MAHTHEFDCRICGAHLDSREELDKHARTEHTAQAGASAKTANPPRTTSGGITSPKFGSAGRGGAELDPGPKRP
jgi:hypothetical protein